MQERRWAFAIFAMLPVALEVRGQRGIRTAGEGCRPVVWDLRGAQASPSARRPGGGGAPLPCPRSGDRAADWDAWAGAAG